MRRPRWQRLALVGTVAAAALLASSCSGAGDHEAAREADISDAQAAQIEQYLSHGALSASQRAALEDYWVSDEEYSHAQDRYRECMAHLNMEIEFDEEGTVATATSEFFAGFPSEDEAWAAHDEADISCRNKHLQAVEYVYHELRDNPEGWTWAESIRACIEALGLDKGRDLSDDELVQKVHEDEDFLPECRLDPSSVARGEQSAVLPEEDQ